MAFVRLLDNDVGCGVGDDALSVAALIRALLARAWDSLVFDTMDCLSLIVFLLDGLALSQLEAGWLLFMITFFSELDLHLGCMHPCIVRILKMDFIFVYDEIMFY